MFSSFLRGIPSPPTTLRPPERSVVRVCLSPRSVPFHVSEEDFSCCFKFFSDESKAEHPASECVFWIFVLLLFWACCSEHLGKLAHCEAKLNVCFQFSCVKSASSLFGAFCKLEKSEFNRSLAPCCVKVQHMVS